MTFVINLSPTKVLHEFGIKHNRYAFCCVMLAGKIAISLPIQFCSEDMVSCPELANQPLRRSHSHSLENALSKPWLCIIRLIAVLNMFWTAVPCYLECCSRWYGTLFQLIWNRATSYLFQSGSLKSSLHELIGWGMKDGVWRLGGWIGGSDRLWNEPPWWCQASIKRYENSG